MQRRRSSSLKRQQTPQTELVPGPSKSKRSLSSERRYSRQYLPNSSVSGGPTDSKIKPHTGEMKTKPLTAFRTPSRNSSVIWSRLTPPSRAPTSFAQVELRKKLMEENLKLAKSLSGLKRQTAASKNSWQLVWRNRAILESLFGDDWNSNPRLHKRVPRTPTKERSKENLPSVRNWKRRARKPHETLESSDTYQPLESAYATREPSTVSIGSRESRTGPTISQCDFKGTDLSLEEIEDWIISKSVAGNFGTSDSVQRQCAPQLLDSTDITMSQSEQRENGFNSWCHSILLDTINTDEIQYKTANEVSSTQICIKELKSEASSPPAETDLIRFNTTAVQEAEVETENSPQILPTIKMEEGTQAKSFLHDVTPSDIKLSQKAAMKVIEYQSQQIKALLSTAQQKPSLSSNSKDEQVSTVDGPAQSTTPTASYWDNKRLSSWVANSQITNAETETVVIQNESKGSLTSASSIESDFHNCVELLSTMGLSDNARKQSTMIDSPLNVVGISTDNLSPCSTITALTTGPSNAEGLLETDESGTKSSKSTEKEFSIASVPSATWTCVDSDVEQVPSVEFQVSGKIQAKVSDFSLEDYPKISLPDLVHTIDSGTSKEIPLECDTRTVKNVSSADNTIALTGTTPSVRSTLIVHSSSQTISNVSSKEPAKAADVINEGSAFSGNQLNSAKTSYNNGNLVGDDANDGGQGNQHAKSVEFSQAKVKNSMSAIRSRSSKLRHQHEVHRRVSFSNPIALYTAVPSQLLNTTLPESADIEETTQRQRLHLTFRYPNKSSIENSDD